MIVLRQKNHLATCHSESGFQNKKRTFSIKHVLIIRFFEISILQGCGRTMLPQRRSEAAVRRCFTK